MTRIHHLALIVLCCLAFAKSMPAQAAGPSVELEIPFEKFVLDNGLTLIVHEDNKAPIVAVNIWYHVGSKNEKPDKTGFAHLFEHLMFNGSEHFDEDFFAPLKKAGVTGMNGTTNMDRTNFFEVVPKTALDMTLWLESDRMGYLTAAISQEKLDEQRDVVKNEKRQRENKPYGKMWDHLKLNTMPAGHPYSWPIIGSMEHLNAASLEDVHEWFKNYYGPSNAVIVIAGDIDAQTAKEKVEKYFGEIPPGPPVARPAVNIAKRTGKIRQSIEDNAPQARLVKSWNVPQWGGEDVTGLDLTSDVLAVGKTSRLYKRLVYDDQICTDIHAWISPGEIAGQFDIMANARPGVDLADVEQAIDEELTRFIDRGPTEDELRRVKTQYVARFVRGAERIGGFHGKSDILAMYEVYSGDPGYYKTVLANVQDATAEDLRGAAERWLTDGEYVLEVHPFPKLKASAETADRSKIPEPGTPADAEFPELQRFELSNGLKAVLAERHAVPLVNFNLIFDAGWASDSFTHAGLADFAMGMLDEGTATRSALEISDEQQMLGASIGAGSNLDQSSVSLSALTARLDESLALYADVILRPSFPEKEFDRLKKNALTGIKSEKANPKMLSRRILPGVLYGKDHPYGAPLTGSGTEDSISKIARDDLAEFHAMWLKPNNATLLIVGDTTVDEIKPKLESLFAEWAPEDTPKKELPLVDLPEKQTIYLIDKPGSTQTDLSACVLAPPRNPDDEPAIEMVSFILGGDFMSRLNMNLREDKGWTYGAGSAVYNGQCQRIFINRAAVQTDKTAEAMAEIARELDEVQGANPPTADELSRGADSKTLQLPGAWETLGGVAGSIQLLVRYDLPDDYFEEYPSKIRALTCADLEKAAKQFVKPQSLSWILVGDRSKIEEPVRALGFGDIVVLDENGETVTGD